jgi:glycosyltransferase involved in cell wall biosynthesis
MILDIMMPFYGRVDHFKEAVWSVLSQTSADWRLTIVDDVYPDLSAGQWAREIQDPRVTYLRNDENLRPSRNYDKCVTLATSEFLVLMGCDDLMEPRFVERVTQLISTHPDVDVIQPGTRVIDQDGHPTLPLADRVKRWYRFGGHGPRVFGGERLARSLLRGNWTYFPSLVWRRSAVADGFRADLDVVQDLAKLLQITFAGGRLLLDDDIVFAYRRHAASVSAVTGVDGSKFAQERALFADAAEKCDERGWRRAARAARWHLTSRLNALSELPAALSRGDRAGRRALSRHVFGGLAAPPAL